MTWKFTARHCGSCGETSVHAVFLFFSRSAPAKLNDCQWDTWSSMKALGSRFCFYAGFVVGTFTLYVFLRQVWFERTLTGQHVSVSNPLQVNVHHPEDESNMWKKDGSALLNLKHPHHTGTGVFYSTPHSKRCYSNVKKHCHYPGYCII